MLDVALKVALCSFLLMLIALDGVMTVVIIRELVREHRQAKGRRP
jgi:hypothetical protein